MDSKLKSAAVVILGGLLACLCVSAQILNVIIGTSGAGSGPAAFTFYVSQSTGSDSNPGTQAQPFQTIAKVNGLSLAAGQSVGFKSGDTWRETLVVPASGSSGSPITFGAYGAGAQPTINGADIPSGWTAYSAAAVAKDTFDGTEGTDNRFSSANSWWGGSFVPTSSYTAVAIATKMAIGSGTPFAHPVSAWIYSDNAGVPGTSIAAATATIQPTLTATETYYSWTFSGASLTSGTKYWLVLNTTLGSPFAKMATYAIGSGSGYVFGTNGTTWTSGFNNSGAVIQTYVAGTPAPNVWQSTVAATPLQVFKDSVLATNGASIVALTEGQWFASGTTLYYYESAGNPGSQAYTLEASTRNEINLNSRSYITIDGLHGTKGNAENVYIGTTNMTGITLQNGLFDYSWGPNVQTDFTIAPNSTNILIQNNEIAYSQGAPGVLNVGGVDVRGAFGPSAVTVQGNNIHDTLGAGVECDQFSSGCLVQLNALHNNLIGFVDDNHDGAKLYYNLIYANGSGINGAGIIVYSATAGTMDSVTIYNNTVYGNHGGGIQIQNNLTNSTIKNNIFQSDGTYYAEMYVFTGLTLTGTLIDYDDYNTATGNALFWVGENNPLTFSAWKTANAPWDANSIVGDPLMVAPASGNFNLQVGSPAIGTGTCITGVTPCPTNIGAK